MGLQLQPTATTDVSAADAPPLQLYRISSHLRPDMSIINPLSNEFIINFRMSFYLVARTVAQKNYEFLYKHIYYIFDNICSLSVSSHVGVLFSG